MNRTIVKDMKRNEVSEDGTVWSHCQSCNTHRNMEMVFPITGDRSNYRLKCPVCGFLPRKMFTTYIQTELFDGICESDSARIEREIREHPEQFPDLIMA